MEKVVKIDGKEVGFRATALTVRLYRHKMRRDIIQDLNKLKKAMDKARKAMKLDKPAEDAPEEVKKAYEEAVRDAQLSVMDLEIFENTAYIMARQYDKSLPDTPEEWLDTFNTFSIFEILPDILELWGMQQDTTSTPKNG